MLRITQVESRSDGPTIKLEGKLLAPWASEIKVACQAIRNRHDQPRLDLSAVTYVDADGIRLLEELAASGVELAHYSHFVATLLHRGANS